MPFRISSWVLMLPVLLLALLGLGQQAHAQQALPKNTPLAQPTASAKVTPVPVKLPVRSKQATQPAKLPHVAAKPTPTPVKKPLNWTAPLPPHILLKAGATSANDIVTYIIYPINLTNRGVWDLHIRVPIPAGATFLVAGAPTPFITSFDGQAITFSAAEFLGQKANSPLQFQLSLKQVTTPVVTTHISATWRYVETNLGTSTFVQEATASGEISIQLHAAQQVVADATGDVPFASYDLIGATLEQDQLSLKLTLNTAGLIGPVGSGHNEYNIYIDNDCNAKTGGQQKGGLGVDYRIRYQHDKGLASLNVWDNTKLVTNTAAITDTSGITGSQSSTNGTRMGGWRVAGALSAIGPPNGHSVTIWVPHALLALGTQICWSADTQDRTNEFISRPPPDQMPEMGGRLLLTQYSAEQKISKIAISDPITETVGYTNNGSIRLVRTITPTLALAPPDFTTVKGKLALSLLNNQHDADIHIFALPEGQEVAKIANASWPVFKFEGPQLLVNRKDGIYTEEALGSSEVRISNAFSNTHPFYNARGEAIVYENVVLTNTTAQDQQGAAGAKNFVPIFQLCNLAPVQTSTQQSPCRMLPDHGAFAAAPLPGEMQGGHPLWAANDTIVYQGCAAWFQPNGCGLYLLRAVKAAGNDGIFLRQLTHNGNDLPTDTRGNVIAFTSKATGDWEVYVMRLDGVWVKNLSQNQKAMDILPAISPDGNWVAFVSNRSGKWAIWVAPILDGEPRKLFDLPSDQPWGEHDQGWPEQHLTWGS